MRVSLAMTTYNGEKYIIEQLDSIRNQTRIIDEVFIQDDCSSDNTALIIQDYIKKWNLSTWSFCTNEINKGWIRNFHECVKKTTGDIIFFCDQDDVWDVKKIEIMSNVMESNENIDVLACRVRLINAEGAAIKDNHEAFPYDSRETNLVKKVEYTAKFAYSISPGCTMGVKRRFVDSMPKLDVIESIPHDALYWKIGVLRGKTYVLDESLISYRIHQNNASNPSNELSIHVKQKNKRLHEAQELNKSLEKIDLVLKAVGDYESVKLLDPIRDFCRHRIEFLTRFSIKNISFIILYYKYYNNHRMMIGDCLSKLKKSN